MHSNTTRKTENANPIDALIAATGYCDIRTAVPGYYVLELSTDDDGAPVAIVKHPVIAWGISPHSGLCVPDAITLDGTTAMNTALQEAAILEPGGQVTARGGYCAGLTFDSVDSYLQREQEDYQEFLQERQRRGSRA
jgi:hypothetical protein